MYQKSLRCRNCSMLHTISELKQLKFLVISERCFCMPEDAKRCGKLYLKFHTFLGCQKMRKDELARTPSLWFYAVTFVADYNCKFISIHCLVDLKKLRVCGQNFIEQTTILMYDKYEELWVPFGKDSLESIELYGCFCVVIAKICLNFRLWN